jgi:membrane-associated phospholipid phosphatase
MMTPRRARSRAWRLCALLLGTIAMRASVLPAQVLPTQTSPAQSLPARVIPVNVLPTRSLQAEALPAQSLPTHSLALREPPTAAQPRVIQYHGAALGLRQRDALKIGGLAATALLLATADRRGDAWARRARVQDNSTLDALSSIGDKSGTYVATGVGPATWLLGRVRGDSGTAVVGLRTTESVAVSVLTIAAIKLVAGRTRPYASRDQSPTHWDLFGGGRNDSVRSFASGHSAAATAAAVTLAAEWRRQGLRGWRTLGAPSVYALATLTAASRVRDRQHWLSDVASGAAIGMVSALVVRRWHDAHPRSRIDRTFLAH